MAGDGKPVVHETSPAVERAALAAKQRAEAAGAPYVRIADWLVYLLEDDEAKPALLITKLGASLDVVRDALAREPVSEVVAPPDRNLFTSARQWSLKLRGDATLTSEFLLLALLHVDPAFRTEMTGHGVDVERLMGLLRSNEIATTPPTAFAPPARESPDSSSVPTPVPTPVPMFRPVAPGPTAIERHAAARVLDANLNRAREALRVLEDFTRFARNDRDASERLKKLRHRLASAASLLPAPLLLAARDTPGDVGTTTTAEGEYERRSPLEVARVNLKRLQESLRSIEEFGKLFGSEFAATVEQIRYASYTVERLLVGGSTLRDRLADARLYVLLTSDRCPLGLERTIGEAAAGGVQVVQLREKSLNDRELLLRATLVRRWTRQAGVLFVLNDRPDLAALVEADGVHLGQDDLPAAEARRIVGPELLIGVSTHSVEQVLQAAREGADYLGVGPTFPSRTKLFDHFPGLEFVREAMETTGIPAFALGGIDATNIGEVVAAGARRVAVSAAIAAAEDPRTAAASLLAALEVL